MLVTGATGFIGRWVWAKLYQAGAHVHAIGRDETQLRDLARELKIEGKYIAADLSVRGAAAAIVERVQPTIVFNLAGYGVGADQRDLRLSQRINADLPPVLAFSMALCPARRWKGQRLVHVGSAFEYGSVDGPVDENTPPHPTTTYAQTKLTGTLAVARAAATLRLRATTARVCTVYGPGEHGHRLLPSLLRIARSGGSIDLTAGEQLRDFTFVGDVAEALLRVGLLHTAPPVINIATGRLISVRDFAETALSQAGGNRSQAHFGAIPYRPDEVWQGPVSTELMRSLLHWLPPTTVEQGIELTLRSLLPESGVSV